MKDKSLFITSVIFLVMYLVLVTIVFTPLKRIFAPLILALAIIYFLLPLIKALERRIKPALAIISVYVGILLLLLFLLLFAIPKIITAGTELINMLQEHFGDFIPDKILSQTLLGNVDKMYTTIVGVVKVGMEILVGAMAAFYILADVNSVKKNLLEFIPLNLKKPVRILLDDVKSSLDSFFKGQLVIAGILFVIEFLFLYAIGVPYAPALSFLAAVLDIIPYAGAFVAMGIIILVTVITIPKRVFFVILGLLIIQQIENNIITPKISSDTLSLHPAVTILVLYIGAFGGFWGILFAIPLTCIFRKIIERLIQSIV